MGEKISRLLEGQREVGEGRSLKEKELPSRILKARLSDRGATKITKGGETSSLIKKHRRRKKKAESRVGGRSTRMRTDGVWHVE